MLAIFFAIFEIWGVEDQFGLFFFGYLAVFIYLQNGTNKKMTKITLSVPLMIFFLISEKNH